MKLSNTRMDIPPEVWQQSSTSSYQVGVYGSCNNGLALALVDSYGDVWVAAVSMFTVTSAPLPPPLPPQRSMTAVTNLFTVQLAVCT